MSASGHASLRRVARLRRMSAMPSMATNSVRATNRRDEPGSDIRSAANLDSIWLFFYAAPRQAQGEHRPFARLARHGGIPAHRAREFSGDGERPVPPKRTLDEGHGRRLRRATPRRPLAGPAAVAGIWAGLVWLLPEGDRPSPPPSAASPLTTVAERRASARSPWRVRRRNRFWHDADIRPPYAS